MVQENPTKMIDRIPMMVFFIQLTIVQIFGKKLNITPSVYK